MDDTENAKAKVNELLASLATGNATVYLEGTVKTIKDAKEKAKELQNAIVMGKKISEYDYYREIKEGFSKIYKGISEYDVLPAFGMKNEEIGELSKIDEIPEDQRKDYALDVLKKVGIDASKIDFSDFQNLATGVLGQVGTRMGSDPAFFKKSKEDVYFKEINDILKTVEEYDVVLKDINLASASKPLSRLVAKALYEKAYENNMKIIRDAYKTLTHKRIDVNKPEEVQGMSDYMREHHPSLMKFMVSQVRADAAHSKYSNIDSYTSEQLLEMSVRNFITSVLGVIAKTDNIADTFEKQVGLVNKFLDSANIPDKKES